MTVDVGLAQGTLLDVVMNFAVDTIRPGQSYIIWSVFLDGWLQKQEVNGSPWWGVTIGADPQDEDDIVMEVVQVPRQEEKVYLVNAGEDQTQSFMDTHGSAYPPNVWQGWRLDPVCTRDEIIAGNTSEARSNLWWSIDECTEGVPGGPTFAITNTRRRVQLGVDTDHYVWAYDTHDGEEPEFKCQWAFVPRNNVQGLCRAFADLDAMELAMEARLL